MDIEKPFTCSSYKKLSTEVLYFLNIALSTTAHGGKINQSLIFADKEVNSDKQFILDMLTTTEIRIYFNQSFSCISIAKTARKVTFFCIIQSAKLIFWIDN